MPELSGYVCSDQTDRGSIGQQSTALRQHETARHRVAHHEAVSHQTTVVADVDTGARAGRAADRLGGAGLGREHLATRFAANVPLDRIDVPLGCTHRPPPPPAGVAVRRTPDAEVVAARPVELVVATRAPGPRPVRDLVPLEPGATEEVVGDGVLLG